MPLAKITGVRNIELLLEIQIIVLHPLASHALFATPKMASNSHFLGVVFPRTTATDRIRILTVCVSVMEFYGVTTAVIGHFASGALGSRSKKELNIPFRAQYMRQRKLSLLMTATMLQ